MRCVLVVCALAVLAQAPAAHAAACTVGQRVIPADGSTGVPLNANVWIFGREQDAYVLVDGVVERKLGHSHWSTQIEKLDLGPLRPNHTYSVKTVTGEHVTTFTTGTAVDSTPPDPPVIEDVRYEEGKLSISATSAETVVVWVSTQRNLKRGLWVWEALPSDGFSTAFDACNQFDAERGGDNCVELRSMDLAGNASTYVSNCAPIIGSSRFLPALPATATRDVTREILMIGFGMFAGLGLIARRRCVAMRPLHKAAPTDLVPARHIPKATARLKND